MSYWMQEPPSAGSLPRYTSRDDGRPPHAPLPPSQQHNDAMLSATGIQPSVSSEGTTMRRRPSDAASQREPACSCRSCETAPPQPHASWEPSAEHLHLQQGILSTLLQLYGPPTHSGGVRITDLPRAAEFDGDDDKKERRPAMTERRHSVVTDSGASIRSRMTIRRKSWFGHGDETLTDGSRPVSLRRKRRMSITKHVSSACALCADWLAEHSLTASACRYARAPAVPMQVGAGAARVRLAEPPR